MSEARRIIEAVLLRRGLMQFVWRPVPVVPEVLGVKAAATMPRIEQLLVDFGSEAVAASGLELDRRLYALRREIETLARAAGVELYVSSMSTRSIVYKGLMMAPALADFYPDLRDGLMETSFAIFHQRFSTNTFPSWPLAQPFRMLGHNGEINTILGNRNGTRLREADLASPVWGKDIAYVAPILSPGQSDSASLDSVAELLALSGRTLPHAMVMLVPEAWESIPDFDPDVRAFYEYHACLNEPWDGPAALIFGDGDIVGATLDRNGLRPARYKVTQSGLLMVSSEVGIFSIDDAITERGRLGPGHMIAVDLKAGKLLRGSEIKRDLAAAEPYRRWLDENLVCLPAHDFRASERVLEDMADLTERQACFGYSREEIKYLFEPMALEKLEPISSMGDDTPLAVLSHLPRLLPTYFKQRFAQVTNPPIDPIREKIVMSLGVNLGGRRNWLAHTPEHAHQVELAGPVVTDVELTIITEAFGAEQVSRLPCVFEAALGPKGLVAALDALCVDAAAAIERGCELLIISDRMVDAELAPIPILLAVGAINNHLLVAGTRLRASVIVESGEPRDVHHFATLIGYGASAVYPYLAIQTIAQEVACEEEAFSRRLSNYVDTIEKGLLKVMSKMGISVLGSYRGSQIFEAIGVGDEVIARCFSGTSSTIKGIGFEEIAYEAIERHRMGFGQVKLKSLEDLGFFRFRRSGELHAWSPQMLGAMGKMRKDKAGAYEDFAREATNRGPVHLRDLLDFRANQSPVALEEVEPIEAIRTRFTTAAMSLGSLSPEAHEAIAVAMNRIGGKSNTGEGGEDPAHYIRRANGDSAAAAIKQVASGRFGVTPQYLAHAQELEIKMAQGSKPGEGGQLPGHKVTEYIAELRHATPGVPLISPPPHHDIYSIEDLAQLIYDLKQVNERADICVKLVAEAGVGTIAAGVAKAYADVILISGHDGGTGASPLSSIKNAGSAWELGLAEVQQVLVLNGLRERVKLRVDGGLKTGRDVVIAAMLGGEEFNFGTAALIAIGCRYVRQCHLDTCPVGIATQRPDLRTKFEGNPEALVRYFDSVAKDVREILASLGVRSISEVIGRTDLLHQIQVEDHPKANSLDLSALIAPHNAAFGAPYRTWARNVRPAPSLNDRIVTDTRQALDLGQAIALRYPICNTDRTVGARLAGLIALQKGNQGLAEGSVELTFDGSAGQSFGAFCIAGLRLILCGEANDYVGKGMSGGEVAVVPPTTLSDGSQDVVIGNTVLYGATGGALLVRGAAGERFAVRNSGATAVVEGVGDHGCEYMTAGQVVVLGPTGKNFGAGMTGGTAYVYDPLGRLPMRCHHDFVILEDLSRAEDMANLRALLERHVAATDSPTARAILDDWSNCARRFWKVVPLASLRIQYSDGGSGGEVKAAEDQSLQAGGE